MKVEGLKFRFLKQRPKLKTDKILGTQFKLLMVQKMKN